MTPVSHDDFRKTPEFNRRAVRARICWRDGAVLTEGPHRRFECPECYTRFHVDESVITEYSPLPPEVNGKSVDVIGTDPANLVHADGRPYTNHVIRAPVYHRSEW